jgi:V-type H+-transporting ATPase subunit a
LWALSLAHSQLSEVFLTMILRPGFDGEKTYISGAIFVVITFVIFFGVSVGVLMLMSMMECMLHALRL